MSQNKIIPPVLVSFVQNFQSIFLFHRDGAQPHKAVDQIITQIPFD